MVSGKRKLTHSCPKEQFSLWLQLPGEHVHQMLQLPRWGRWCPLGSALVLRKQRFPAPLFHKHWFSTLLYPWVQSLLAFKICSMVCEQSNCPKTDTCSQRKKLYQNSAELLPCPCAPACSTTHTLLIQDKPGACRSSKYICSLHIRKPWMYLQTTLKVKPEN